MLIKKAAIAIITTIPMIVPMQLPKVLLSISLNRNPFFIVEEIHYEERFHLFKFELYSVWDLNP